MSAALLLSAATETLSGPMTIPDPYADPVEPPPRIIRLFGREFALPRSRGVRIAIGVVLCIFGVFGFLPVLGFWMIPLGLLVLSYEFAAVRRFRRRTVVWWERRKRPAAGMESSQKSSTARDVGGDA